MGGRRWEIFGDWEKRCSRRLRTESVNSTLFFSLEESSIFISREISVFVRIFLVDKKCSARVRNGNLHKNKIIKLWKTSKKIKAYWQIYTANVKSKYRVHGYAKWKYTNMYKISVCLKYVFKSIKKYPPYFHLRQTNGEIQRIFLQNVILP